MAGKYAKQLAKYNSILSKNSQDPSTLAILARIAVKEARIDDAENYYNTVILNDPNHSEALYMIGFFNMKKNKYNEAIKYFKKLLYNGKENAFIYEYLSIMDKENRREYLEKALEISKNTKIISKDYKRCAYMAFQTFAWREYDISLEYANFAYDAKPTNDIINLLGCIHHNNEDYDKALSLFHEVNANYEWQNSYILCNISSCYRNKNSNKMAIRYLEKALEVNNNDKLIYYNIGSIYASTGNKKLAAENFEQAIKIDNDYEEAKKALESIKD
ncbi:tetratricopeptide repeat protein [Brachyspira sp.]|uniref:tetratricopeptide repeat protein n=1 Tax=Brachyspira sp. TaxID=1977261 RepID=UPI00260F39AC|nr:tetratricopeptide repeat protein [Brachyspira sp.]